MQNVQVTSWTSDQKNNSSAWPGELGSLALCRTLSSGVGEPHIWRINSQRTGVLWNSQDSHPMKGKVTEQISKSLFWAQTIPTVPPHLSEATKRRPADPVCFLCAPGCIVPEPVISEPAVCPTASSTKSCWIKFQEESNTTSGELIQWQKRERSEIK